MTLINCCENCVYQNDGFCSLDCIGRVTNLSPTGCIHMLERSKADQISCPAKNYPAEPLVLQRQPSAPFMLHSSTLSDMEHF